MRCLILIVVMSATAAASDLVAQESSRLKLRARVEVCGEIVRLADVLDFSEADPRLREAIGDQALWTESPSAPARTLATHDQVCRRLSELGVNMSRVLVTGALSCQVNINPRVVETANRAGTGGENPLLRPRPQINGTTTLADRLREYIEDELQERNGTIEIEFEHAGREFLDLTEPPFAFTIRAERGRRLGLREFRVTLIKEGRVQRTVVLGARVRFSKQVLVAAKPLNVGSYVRRDSVELGHRIFTQDEDFGIEHPEQVVGQKVKNFVPVGQMVRAGDLKTVDLVRRSQPVTVIGGDVGPGEVSIRLTGDALDSGGYGDVVRVRLGDNRKNYREIRGTVVGVGAVRLNEGNL